MSGVFVRSMKAPDVADQPVATLIDWSVFEIPGGGRHFCGLIRDGKTAKGRVSSEIVGFDPDTMTGMTSSGRLYRLEGEPCQDDALEPVRIAWLAGYGLPPSASTPVDMLGMAPSMN